MNKTTRIWGNLPPLPRLVGAGLDVRLPEKVSDQDADFDRLNSGFALGNNPHQGPLRREHQDAKRG